MPLKAARSVRWARSGAAMDDDAMLKGESERESEVSGQSLEKAGEMWFCARSPRARNGRRPGAPSASARYQRVNAQRSPAQH